MKYQLIRVYSDLTSATETTTEITAALHAAAIYLADRDCIGIEIWEYIPGGDFCKILNYDRP